MSGTHAEQTAMTKPAQSESDSRGSLLQRKCACGGAAGLTGACAQCESKKILGKPLPTTLRINKSGDESEQNADRVANQVIGMSDSQVSKESQILAETPSVQGRSVGASATLEQAPSTVRDALSSPGQPLDATTRSFFEPRFGHDFGHVRVHVDDAADSAAAAIQAHAFTVSANIFLRQGQYAPHTSSGQRLLAHELVHTVQQNDSGPLLQKDDDEAAKKKLAAERVRARQRLETWAQGKKPAPSTDPGNKDFAFTAQELAYEITHKPAPDTTELIDKPADKTKQKAWEIAFRDAYHLALMILESTKADQREARAGLIASDLAAAGFITEALDLAGKLPDENKKFIYDTVTQTPKNASAEQIKLVSTFFAGREATPGDHPLLDKLTDRSGDYARLLGKSKLIAALEPTLAKYKKDADYLEGLAEILVFEPGSRVAISDWLWTTDKAYLFEILSSDYFVEPGYGGKQFADAAGQARALTMAADMPWVYSYKQKYYTDFLVNLGKKHKIEIAAPASLKFNDLKKWLDAETKDIGAALAAEFPNSPEKITDAYENIADIYFFHVDRGDVTPDLAGKLGHLPAAEPALMRLKSDCDVLATYATRLLRSAGFTPVGYMAIMPTKGVGHAVALLKKAPPAEPAAAGETPKQPPERYYIVNNKQVTANDAATKEKAIKAMRDDALKIYDPVPDAYKVCYDDAATNGAMTQAVWTLAESTRRKDLEPATNP